jgi:hypothetical protein
MEDDYPLGSLGGFDFQSQFSVEDIPSLFPNPIHPRSEGLGTDGGVGKYPIYI